MVKASPWNSGTVNQQTKNKMIQKIEVLNKVQTSKYYVWLIEIHLFHGKPRFMATYTKTDHEQTELKQMIEKASTNYWHFNYDPITKAQNKFSLLCQASETVQIEINN